MKRQSVKSSNINSIGYDEDTQTLEVEFSSGDVYQYFNVPPKEYQALIRASSHGKYLNQNVKDKYRFKRI